MLLANPILNVNGHTKGALAEQGAAKARWTASLTIANRRATAMFFVLERLDDHEKARIEKSIRAVVERSLGDAVKDVRIDWDQMREDEARIEVFISIEAATDPKQWRSGFAGLTSRIRSAMGEKLENVFPILMAKAA
ncbi:hypothetical protein IQ250_30645 [Pseudanabaenaceae cyanobacterium LEGE 13415]|nr:hypothetical protein [Pseudanabaenaceae cyanobacterium LEGE 13415]